MDREVSAVDSSNRTVIFDELSIGNTQQPSGVTG